MNKKIAVVGAGAIGSSVSADLTKAGLDVTVIDQWPAQVEKLKADGLIVRMPDLEVRTPIRALHLCELASANLEFDIVLLAVKSNDHRWLTELIKPYLKADGVLVPVQNGFNDDSIASIIGREHGIATPFNDAIVEIDRMINKGQLKMGPDNFKLLQEKVGIKPKV